jgi:hypothetical protein
MPTKNMKNIDAELQYIHPGTCELEDISNNEPGSLALYRCTFELKRDQLIQAEIFRGKKDAYQFRFAKKDDAQQALDWIKKEAGVDLSQARVSAPKIQGQSYLFRLVGDDQWNAFHELTSGSNTPRP